MFPAIISFFKYSLRLFLLLFLCNYHSDYIDPFHVALRPLRLCQHLFYMYISISYILIIYILLFKRLVSHILKYVIPSSFLKSSISKCHVPCAQACLILCDPRGYNLTIRSSRQEYFANFLLQGIFSTQGSNPHLLCLLHHRQIP